MAESKSPAPKEEVAEDPAERHDKLILEQQARALEDKNTVVEVPYVDAYGEPVKTDAAEADQEAREKSTEESQKV